MGICSFKNVTFKMRLEITYLLYMHEEDLALNNLQWLICHKIESSQIISIQYQTKSYTFDIYV